MCGQMISMRIYCQRRDSPSTTSIEAMTLSCAIDDNSNKYVVA